MSAKERLDKLVLQQQLASSLEKAGALIMSGVVLVNGQVVSKAGQLVKCDSILEIKGKQSSYVSRGGDKLAPALKHFAIDVNGTVAIDIGASTGGFTDCLLQHGAALVYAVDIGKNLLNFRLKEDPKVQVLEETHVRSLPSLKFEPRPTLATVDVSFIGLQQVLGAIKDTLPLNSIILALVKPQFELEPELVEEGGVVNSVENQRLAVNRVRDYGIGLGLSYQGDFPSPVKGAKKGNQEYFLCFYSLQSANK